MRTPWSGILWLSIPLVFLACSSTRTASRVGRQTTPDTREEYLRSNPHGEFNHLIERGEVAPGMGVEEVIASWGMPSIRARETRQGRELESWTYPMKHPGTGTTFRYRLYFEGYRLAFWDVDRSSRALSIHSGPDAEEERSSWDNGSGEISKKDTP
jgi:hypothetical protein